MILAPLQKLLKNVGDSGKLIVAKGFKKLPKVQKIANSGYTVHIPSSNPDIIICFFKKMFRTFRRTRQYPFQRNCNTLI